MHPASGTGIFAARAEKVIRFVRKGCANRPFFHISVTQRRRHLYGPVIEQLGTYDPIPNQHNEKLTSLNFERIGHWIGNGALVSKPVEQLFGLCGYFPVHPTSYMQAWRNRAAVAKAKVDEEEAKSKPATS